MEWTPTAAAAAAAARKRRSSNAFIGAPLDSTDVLRSQETYGDASSITGYWTTTTTTTSYSNVATPCSPSREYPLAPVRCLDSFDEAPLAPQSIDVPRFGPISRKKTSSLPTAVARKVRRCRQHHYCRASAFLVLVILIALMLLMWLAVWLPSQLPSLWSTSSSLKSAKVRVGERRRSRSIFARPSFAPLSSPPPVVVVPNSAGTTTTTTKTVNTTTAAGRQLWSVMVQHEDAASRLSLPPSACTNADDNGRCFSPFVDPQVLPSWTLQVIPKECADCADPELYAVAVRTVATALQPHHAVFASRRSPLGRIGPMLFAMSSVTNDVAVREELWRWTWLRQVNSAYADYLNNHHSTTTTTTNTTTTTPTAAANMEAQDEDNIGVNTTNAAGAAAAAAGVRRGYLAVMGVPSTDQPARVALRDAQRATWMSYQEVARSENGFDGALLPLYLFAATEPLEEAAAHLAQFAPEALTPPTTSFLKASAMLAGKDNEDGADESVEERRVTLRSDWNEKNTQTSPCMSVVSSTMASGVSSTPLAYLSDALGTPVTPAFVSPAENICCASAALWQEALTHRNVIWIDMMTDRTPTTDKKLGDTKKWGLPVEVGMSQKLILWLSYAYHAFPDVPFIIKGDDDAYVKVPQFLRDIRFVRGGAQIRQPSTSTELAAHPDALQKSMIRTAKPSHEMTNVATTTDTITNNTSDVLPECIYWGSTRAFRQVMFNAGMLFMVHRSLLRGVLAAANDKREGGAGGGNGGIDIIDLAVNEFSWERAPQYRRARLHQEDILLGLRLHAARKSAEAVCPGNRMWYVMEGPARFHDMHRGKVHAVTWSTVVAHRCTPADTYFLHYYFQREYLHQSSPDAMNVARDHDGEEKNAAAKGRGDSVSERKAIAEAARWVAAQMNTTRSTVVGWKNLPVVRWVRSSAEKVAFSVDIDDKVALYNNAYTPWKDAENHVDYGYQAMPLE